MGAISSEEIRKLVGEVLKDALPAIKSAPAAAAGLLQRIRAAMAGTGRVEVAIALDSDLNSFARDLVTAAEQAEVREAVKTGALTFTLMRAGTAVQALPVQAQHRVDKGLITETMVTEIGRKASRIVIGKGVVVTPLGRDRARELKIEIVRDRS